MTPLKGREGKMKNTSPEYKKKVITNTHPCRKCKGKVPDGAIYCIHCKVVGRETTNP